MGLKACICSVSALPAALFARGTCRAAPVCAGDTGCTSVLPNAPFVAASCKTPQPPGVSQGLRRSQQRDPSGLFEARCAAEPFWCINILSLSLI